MVQEFASTKAEAATGPSPPVQIVDFILFVTKMVEAMSPQNPGTAAGAYGVFFDMTSTAGKLQAGRTMELFGSMGVPLVEDEAEDMLRYAQGQSRFIVAHSPSEQCWYRIQKNMPLAFASPTSGMSLKGGQMGFTGSETHLPRKSRAASPPRVLSGRPSAAVPPRGPPRGPVAPPRGPPPRGPPTHPAGLPPGPRPPPRPAMPPSAPRPPPR